MINASLGETQDSSEIIITSYKAGYLKEVPDLNIMEMTSKYNGFFIEFKSPTLKGVFLPQQKLGGKKFPGPPTNKQTNKRFH